MVLFFFFIRQNIGLFLPRHIVAKGPVDTLIQKVNETASAMQISNFDARKAKFAFLRDATTKFIWSWTFFPLQVCF